MAFPILVISFLDISSHLFTHFYSQRYFVASFNILSIIGLIVSCF